MSEDLQKPLGRRERAGVRANREPSLGQAPSPQPSFRSIGISAGASRPEGRFPNGFPRSPCSPEAGLREIPAPKSLGKPGVRSQGSDESSHPKTALLLSLSPAVMIEGNCDQPTINDY